MLHGMSPKVLLQPVRMFSVVAGIVGLVCQMGGCAYGELDQVLRAEVATETKCTDVVVKPAAAFERGWKPNQYKVSGCGVDRVYTCDRGGLVEYASAKDICNMAPSQTASPNTSAGGDVSPGDLEAPSEDAPEAAPSATES